MLRLTVKSTEPTKLEELIDMVQTLMLKTTPGTSEFDTLTDQLVKLHKMQETERSQRRVNADVLAQIGGSLAGILAILSYERAHVVTSKALGFVVKAVKK